MYDITIIGGGIVGISTAWQLKKRYPDKTMLVLEKESGPGRHQTGHNSGVIHAGVYYQPGSLKAEFCRRGSALTMEFCREHGLPYDQCGKLLVATNSLELNRMGALEKRCIQNGIEIERLSQKVLNEREPAINGVGALFANATGITDYPQITAKMAELFIERGGEIRYGREVQTIIESTHEVKIHLAEDFVKTRYVVVCGGLMADRLARMMNIAIDFQIIPFRGEYYLLDSNHNNIVNHLIYPIPDPGLPFLGVHLTRMIDGTVTVGPNAVMGWKREGYGRINLDFQDIKEMAAFPGFWRVLGDNWKSGFEEMRDSLFPSGYLKRVQRYCPQLVLSDFAPYPVGIRAQAVKRNGELVHDFLFAKSPRSLHVCNAPSPAATSAIPIGNYLCQTAAADFGL